MAVINNVTEVLHRIRARLYPNYLHGIDGAYIARCRGSELEHSALRLKG